MAKSSVEEESLVSSSRLDQKGPSSNSNSNSNSNSRSSGNSGGGGVVKKGSWTPCEDALLLEFVERYGDANWNNAHLLFPGLRRGGKSCRMRYRNQLRHGLRKGPFTPAEQLLVTRGVALYGNQWSKIADMLPGRTDNSVKNFWNVRLKRLKRQQGIEDAVKRARSAATSSNHPTQDLTPSLSLIINPSVNPNPNPMSPCSSSACSSISMAGGSHGDHNNNSTTRSSSTTRVNTLLLFTNDDDPRPPPIPSSMLVKTKPLQEESVVYQIQQQQQQQQQQCEHVKAVEEGLCLPLGAPRLQFSSHLHMPPHQQPICHVNALQQELPSVQKTAAPPHGMNRPRGSPDEGLLSATAYHEKPPLAEPMALYQVVNTTHHMNHPQDEKQLPSVQYSHPMNLPQYDCLPSSVHNIITHVNAPDIQPCSSRDTFCSPPPLDKDLLEAFATSTYNNHNKYNHDNGDDNASFLTDCLQSLMNCSDTSSLPSCSKLLEPLTSNSSISQCLEVEMSPFFNGTLDSLVVSSSLMWRSIPTSTPCNFHS